MVADRRPHSATAVVAPSTESPRLRASATSSGSGCRVPIAVLSSTPPNQRAQWLSAP